MRQGERERPRRAGTFRFEDEDNDRGFAMRHSQLILKNLRLCVMDNSTAFAFSTTITGSFALLNAKAPAGVPEIFAGAAGAAAAFMVAEWLALLFLRDQPDNESTGTRLLCRMLNFVSVGCALAAVRRAILRSRTVTTVSRSASSAGFSCARTGWAAMRST
ncbi:hypothetical protein [Aurantimonas sp. VKM B-3413]|uniref:hypothetical protein n=1 Tax=Aurantimonas sp. VKM B-3413 TaxID=2779401 RepID=UPI001E2B2884|nr:hypothetical protein [Aurantimonas sp. VKM B-3413]MCB8839656.1 hypothetical protein [Aurantimonas sp. VKM B-3413]